MFPEKLSPLTMTMLLAMIAASGCGSDSDRVAQVALEGSQRQAALDQEMARLNREVTEGTRQLIQSRGEADRQILAQQQDLQQQRQQLDDERRDVASQRLHESLLAPIFMNLGWLAVGSLPLILCWYLLHGLGRESAETPVTQLLVDHLMLSDDPLVQPGTSSDRLTAHVTTQQDLHCSAAERLVGPAEDSAAARF